MHPWARYCSQIRRGGESYETSSEALLYEHRRPEYPGRRRTRFRFAAADNDQIFVDHPRAGEGDVLRTVIAAETFPQVDSAGFSKLANRFAGGCIERIEIIHHAGKNAALLAIGPVEKTAGRRGAENSGVEFPKQLAGGGVEGDHFLGRCKGIKNTPDDDRAGL